MEQKEELRKAVLREALLKHPDHTARPARGYPQDKISTAWKLGLPKGARMSKERTFETWSSFAITDSLSEEMVYSQAELMFYC